MSMTVSDDVEDSGVATNQIRFTINGEKKVAEVEPRLLLAHLIRQGLKLTGTHTGCDTTNCGACTVLVDGLPIKSCTMLAVQVDGRDVVTVEGLATPERTAPDPRELQGRARAAVWLLHPRHDDGDQGPARSQPQPDRGRGPVGPVGQPVPLHRLSEHREGGPLGGRRKCKPRG